VFAWCVGSAVTSGGISANKTVNPYAGTPREPSEDTGAAITPNSRSTRSRNRSACPVTISQHEYAIGRCNCVPVNSRDLESSPYD
jgi:hypothetical protein